MSTKISRFVAPKFFVEATLNKYHGKDDLVYFRTLHLLVCLGVSLKCGKHATSTSSETLTANGYSNAGTGRKMYLGVMSDAYFWSGVNLHLSLDVSVE